MTRRTLLALVTFAVVTPLVGCGGRAPSPTVPHPTAPSCNPPAGFGTMGACPPGAEHGLLLQAPRPGTLIPDVSEFQSCRLFSEAIIRLYEAGLEREDTTAGCHARELHRLKAWGAGYAFVRPGHGGCRTQADRTVAIANRLGGLQVLVDDAEVPLPAGFVGCFNSEIRRDGYPAATYTSFGTQSGGPLTAPIWAASYGAPSRCIGGVCRFVAEQFSSAFECRGVFGDCSVDEGILSIRRVDRAGLLARQRTLRRVLVRFGCRRRVRERERVGPRCSRWFAEGRAVDRRLATT